MAEGGFPNKNRASNALDIYRDAMRGYVAPILERKHGSDWVLSQVLNDELRERNPNSYDRRLQSLKAGTLAHNLVDLAEVPFLIRDNEDVFSDLRTADTHRMHQIRDLRNEIQHPDREGDCTPEEAASIAGLCVLVLERCGLPDAVERIRRLSSSTPASTPAVPEAELQQQRERREWDKVRLAGKLPEELTSWEQQRLAEIEWEEEWERRELVRREREEIAGFGDDIDGLRRWFNEIPGRRERHSTTHATLVQRIEEQDEEWQRQMNRLLHHRVDAYVQELIALRRRDRALVETELERLAAVQPSARQKAMQRMRDDQPSLWRWVMSRWWRRHRSLWRAEMDVLREQDREAWLLDMLALQDRRGWSSEMRVLQQRDVQAWSEIERWRDDMELLRRDQPSAWQLTMDGLRERDRWEWRREMDALLKRDDDGWSSEMSSLHGRDPKAWASEMNALRQRNPVAWQAQVHAVEEEKRLQDLQEANLRAAARAQADREKARQGNRETVAPKRSFWSRILGR